jgi:hypothetical protein
MTWLHDNKYRFEPYLKSNGDIKMLTWIHDHGYKIDFDDKMANISIDSLQWMMDNNYARQLDLQKIIQFLCRSNKLDIIIWIHSNISHLGPFIYDTELINTICCNGSIKLLRYISTLQMKFEVSISTMQYIYDSVFTIEFLNIFYEHGDKIICPIELTNHIIASQHIHFTYKNKNMSVFKWFQQHNIDVCYDGLIISRCRDRELIKWLCQNGKNIN